MNIHIKKFRMTAWVLSIALVSVFVVTCTNEKMNSGEGIVNKEISA